MFVGHEVLKNGDISKEMLYMFALNLQRTLRGSWQTLVTEIIVDPTLPQRSAHGRIHLDIFKLVCSLQEGRVICTSEPIYGEGKDAGDEAGYVVGMSTCYPEPGSIQITAGENLVLESYYSSTQKHTAVMGIFYILVAERTPNPTNFLHSPIHIHEKMKVSASALAIVVLLGLAVVDVGLRYRLKKGREEGYQPIMA
ncbi:hypothetical protein NC651_029047 [Populus alba x Populus x berolinensis]|nr:hypothetical protein NC651_029047 [Populus alba x Populus x berolinensis]